MHVAQNEVSVYFPHARKGNIGGGHAGSDPFRARSHVEEKMNRADFNECNR